MAYDPEHHDTPTARARVGGQLVMHAVRNWWLLATPPGLILGALASLAVWFHFEPIYRATAWLKIEAHTMISPTREDMHRFARTQIELIRSPLVLNVVLSDPAIARLPDMAVEEDQLQYLTENVEVESVASSDLFQIRFDASSPDAATKIVNKVLDAYLETRASDVDEQSVRMISILEDDLSTRRKALEELQEKVRRLTKEAAKGDVLLGQRTGGDKARTDSAVVDALAKLRQDLITKEVAREMLQARLQVLEDMDKTAKATVDESLIEEQLQQHPHIKQLQAQIEAGRSRLASLKAAAIPGSKIAPVAMLESDLKHDEKQLEELIKAVRPTIEKQVLSELSRNRSLAIEDVNLQIKTIMLEEEAYKKRLGEQRGDLQEQGNDTINLEFARDEKDRAEEVYGKIAQRLDELRTSLRAPERVSLLNRATMPRKPIEVIPYKNLIAAGVAGFCFPFFLALLWEIRIRRIADPEQVTQETNLTLLGEITTLPMRSLVAPGKKSKRFESDRDTFEESIDYLRTSLLLSHAIDTVQVLAVASATSSEGKSSLASHLAVSLARACQEPVLLIDADMRDPDVHRMFGIAGGPGLAEVLDGRSRLEDCVVTNSGGNLHFLPAGRLSMSPHILLGEGRFAALLERLRPGYRHIVVDAPPVLPAGDALIIARAADGTLMCTMRDVSRGPQVRMACERLTRAGARLLGAVLSGVPAQTYVQRYGSYRYAYPRFRDTDAPAPGAPAIAQQPIASEPPSG